MFSAFFFCVFEAAKREEEIFIIFVAKILRKKYNEPVLYKIDKKDGVYRNDSIIILSIPPARSLQGFGISKTLQI